VDFTKPRIAAIYDYLIEGKNHMARDRSVGDRLIAAGPAALRARENREFLTRVVRYLAAEAGIRQFLDIGSGYPVTGCQNVHEIAQAVAPMSRVAYVDNDSIVVTHARALMASTMEGQVTAVPWDLRYDDPDKLLSDPVIRGTIDFEEPTAVLIVGVLPFVPDEHDPVKTIQRLVDALAPGSYIVASHPTAQHHHEGAAAVQQVYRDAGIPVQFRDSHDFARLAFHGAELVPPGVVPVSQWRAAGSGPTPLAAAVSCYGGVARMRLTRSVPTLSTQA
jgi:hypothetical protein